MSAPPDIGILREAKANAKKHGLFVVEKPTGTAVDYVVYRILPDRNVRIGASHSPAALRRFIARAACSRRQEAP